MTSLEQHLAAHWPTVHTHAGLHWSHMYQCKCGWMPTQDDPRPVEVIHAAHVAATWREARTVRTVEELDALPFRSTLIEPEASHIWIKHSDLWHCSCDGTSVEWTAEDVFGDLGAKEPLVILHQPDPEDGAL